LLFQLVGPERPSQILRIGPDYFEHAQAQPMQQAEDFLNCRGSFDGLPCEPLSGLSEIKTVTLGYLEVDRIAVLSANCRRGLSVHPHGA
jgi:hypothetical protein